MSLYSIADEQRIRMQALVRGWTRAGLLEASQGARLQEELKVSLLRTGRMLRAGLALFTVFAVAAAVGLVFVLFDLGDEGAIFVVTAFGAAVCLGMSQLLVRRFRLYRYGVEETLAVAAVVLAAVSAAALTAMAFGSSPPWVRIAAALAAAAAGGYALYRRFGFVYAAVAAMVCAALLPFQPGLPSPIERLLAAAVCTGVFMRARPVRIRHGDDFPGDDAGIVQAAAFVGGYLVLNLFVSPFALGIGSAFSIAPWFKWTTYVLTWAIPAAGLWRAVRDRDPLLLDAGLVTALVTILTNKTYLGLARQAWDPMLLGVLLVVVSLAVRRWLSFGPDGARAGFTAARLSADDPDVMRVASVVSAGVQPARDMGDAHPAPSGFEGGRSGGAGGGAGF